MAVTRRASAFGATPSRKDEGLFADLDHAHRRRGCFSCRNLGCAFVLVLVLGVVALFGMVARTGLVTIPVLSSALYQQPPKPIRAVEPIGQTSLESLLASKVKAAEITAAGGQIRIALTESELTKLVQEPRANGQVPVKQAQVTIEPTFIELYGLINMPNGEKSAVLRIRLEPGLKASELHVAEIRLGYVRVPIQLAKVIVRMATGIMLPDSVSGTSFGIHSITLNRGTVTATIDEQVFRSVTEQN